MTHISNILLLWINITTFFKYRITVHKSIVNVNVTIYFKSLKKLTIEKVIDFFCIVNDTNNKNDININKLTISLWRTVSIFFYGYLNYRRYSINDKFVVDPEDIENGEYFEDQPFLLVFWHIHSSISQHKQLPRLINVVQFL